MYGATGEIQSSSECGDPWGKQLGNKQNEEEDACICCGCMMSFTDYVIHLRDLVSQAFTSLQTTHDIEATVAELAEAATTSTERSISKDDVKRESENLSQDLDSLQRDYKKLKQVVEQLEKEYEESKDFDPLRRYEKLKGMIKRTILHFRLKPDEKGTTTGIGGLLQGCKEYAYSLEAVRRREEKRSCRTKQELMEENLQLQEQIKEMRRKCSIIRDLIDHLENGYESSKRFAMMQRYRLMKCMIKKVIHDRLI